MINSIDMNVDCDSSDFAKVLEFITNSEIYKPYFSELSNQHRISHIQKVLLFSQIIAQNEGLNEEQIKVLLLSAAYHDCGRKKDRDNGEHGIISAKIAGEYLKRNPYYYGIEKREIGLIQTAIEYHVIEEQFFGKMDETKLKILCAKYGVNDEDYENTKSISTILKDADALDRTRFVSGSNLNPDFLRTNTAKNKLMIEFAKKINEIYAAQIINLNYQFLQDVSEDKIKLLHDIRNKYKEQKRTIQRNEIDIPLNIVKSIFRQCLIDDKDNKRIVYSKYEEENER